MQPGDEKIADLLALSVAKGLVGVDSHEDQVREDGFQWIYYPI